MRYSIESRQQRHVKGHKLLSFAKYVFKIYLLINLYKND